LTSQPNQVQIKPLGDRRQRISTTFETQPQASHDATVQVAGLSGDMSATGALTPLAQAPIKIMTTDSQSLSTGATSMSSTAAVEGIAHSASGTVVVKLGTTASQ
jgi:hypothetical protein